MYNEVKKFTKRFKMSRGFPDNLLKYNSNMTHY